MKLLLRRVEKLAGRVLRRRRREAVGIAWVSDWPDLTEANLVDLVEDVHVMRTEGAVDEWTLTARAPRYPGDLGDVYDSSGALIGRVTKREGTLIEFDELRKAAP